MTPLDSRQLLGFVTLAETGSFTETAKRLFLTQSAISHSIKGLESDLGCKLFTRVGKKTHLSEAGERFLPSAHRILHDMEGARHDIDELNQRGSGRIRIGASTTASQYILPAVLRELKERFPQCRITIASNDTPQAIEDVCSNLTDISITLAPEGIHKCLFLPLFQDELRLITAPQHPWATSASVKQEEIQEETFILYSRGSHTFRIIQDYFRDQNVEIDRIIELGSNEAIKELVKTGMGVGILPTWIVHKELDANELASLPLGPKQLHRRWGISYQKGRKLNRIEDTFIRLCESTIETMGLSRTTS